MTCTQPARRDGEKRLTWVGRPSLDSLAGCITAPRQIWLAGAPKLLVAPSAHSLFPHRMGPRWGSNDGNTPNTTIEMLGCLLEKTHSRRMDGMRTRKGDRHAKARFMPLLGLMWGGHQKIERPRNSVCVCAVPPGSTPYHHCAVTTPRIDGLTRIHLLNLHHQAPYRHLFN